MSLESVNRALTREILALEHRTRGGVHKAALFAQGNSQKRCPVDTGAMKASANTTMDGNEPIATIAYHQAYAPFVHENLNAHHPTGEAKFLQRAIDQNHPTIIGIIKDEARIR